jgi:hypothetical protein
MLLQGSINYYCQAKFYRHLQNVCLEGLQKHGGDAVLMFWKAFGVLMEGLLFQGCSKGIIVLSWLSVGDKLSVIKYLTH